MNINTIKKVDTITYDCPFCEQEHELKIIQYNTNATVKNVEVEYTKKSYYCDIEDDEFVPEKVMDENLLKAREAYRKKKGLLLASEIKAIRSEYGLNQKEYANLLGVGDVTIQRYEKKSIQDNIYDMLIRLTRDNPSYCLQMLNRNKDEFDAERFRQIREKIVEKMKDRGVDYLVQEEVRVQYAEYNSPSSENGFSLLNIEKISLIMNYLSRYIQPLYKVKLMKLLWYVDELSYKYHQKSITGLVYRHMPLGALPIGHYDLMKLPDVTVTEEEHEDYIALKVMPKGDIELGKFSFNELDILQQIVKKFQDFTTHQIVEYMHNENAYKRTSNNEIILFNKENEIQDFVIN